MSKEPKETKQGLLEVKQRWSVRRKREVVVRLLRGEPLDAVSRDVGLEVYRLEQWRDKALAAMEQGLKDRTGDPLQAELDTAMQHIGELSMACELLRRERQQGGPLARKRRPK